MSWIRSRSALSNSVEVEKEEDEEELVDKEERCAEGLGGLFTGRPGL